MHFNSRRSLIKAAALLSVCLSTVSLYSEYATAQTTEIVYSTFLDPNNTNDPRSAAQTKMIQAFESKYPNIKIKLLIDPSGQSVTRAVKSKSETPDVIRVVGFGVPEYAATGNLVQLDDLIKKDGISTEDWLLPLSSAQVNGKLFSLPQDFRIPVLFYRKSMLKEAGLVPPKTWDEVCAAGSKLTNVNIAGFAVPLGGTGGIGGAQALGEFYLSSMLSSENGKYFNEDGTIAFNKAAFTKTAQTIKDFFTKCKITPARSAQMAFNEVHDGLRSNTIAMTNFGVYRYKTIQQQGVGDDLGWAPSPGFSATDKQTVYGYHVALNKQSKNQDAAWTFMKFVVSPEGQAVAAEGGEVVSRKSAYKASYFQTDAAKNQKDWADLIEQRGRTVVYTPLLSNFHTIVGEAFQKLILRDETPDNAFDEVVKRYEEALAKSK